MFDNLLHPIDLGPTRIANRVFNPPHGTTLAKDGSVSDELIAYHRARASGGVGLTILEGMTFHPSYGYPEAFLYAGSDQIITGLHKLGKACRAHGTAVFGQLFHAGRAVRLSHDGSRPPTYSASDIPDERYRVVPIPMPNEMVWELIDSYAAAAGRLAEAELDGVEILASTGYLIAQFLNPATNRREDEFGGTDENRSRFLQEIVRQCRLTIGSGKTLGIRITLDEKTDQGLDAGAVIRICQSLESDGYLDYFSVISGSSAAPGGWVHVFPPMAVPQGFVVDDAARLKAAVSKPVLVAGRINRPQLGEQIVADGKADMVGMARALIADPMVVNKFSNGRAESIRACIGCNQACVGHRLAHYPISCIQNPVSGRELNYPVDQKPRNLKRVVVVGGGPGGMKAAVVAAQRGHQVTLYEQSTSLGGQVSLAERLPGRAEFGGVTTNLRSELTAAGVDVCLGEPVTVESLEQLDADFIVLATGAVSRLPEVEMNDIDVMDGWSLLAGNRKPGHNVVIADWACDWIGLGLTHKLALEGHNVQLMCGGSVAGESIQGIVRDQWIGALHRLQAPITPFARLVGAEGDTVFFQHMTSGEPIILEQMDAIVSCYAPRSNPLTAKLRDRARELDMTSVTVGDALSPRSVEEAVLEGLNAAWSIH